MFAEHGKEYKELSNLEHLHTWKSKPLHINLSTTNIWCMFVNCVYSVCTFYVCLVLVYDVSVCLYVVK